MTYSTEQLREAWLAAALDEWKRVVRDDDKGKPGTRDVITGYFHAVGWANYVPGGYVERPNNPWCGHFAGAMGLRIGDYLVPGQCVGAFLDPDIALYVTPSTKRLHSRAKWDAAGVPAPRIYEAHSVSGERYLDRRAGKSVTAEEVLLPGVLATVSTREYGDERDEVGGHIVLVEKLGDGVVHTVEGNGRGELGDGTRGEGVVRAVRPLSSIRRVYHLEARHHFDFMER